MNEIKLLDCTLRDGGYVNDWAFGNDDIINIFERLVSANLDIIEVGFLDESRDLDINRTIMPDSSAVNTIYGGMDKGNSLVVGMIDYGTCGINSILPCSQCFLDGIRVIFKKKVMVEAIAFCKEVKALGYKVFVQAVSITSYSDKEMALLLDLVNELEPYVFSIVDTYGLLHKNNLIPYYELANEGLRPSIGLGYHSHNNFQLAYANCIELLDNPPEKRMLLVDGSLYGMGKGAGNAPTELLAMYMKEHFDKPYHLAQILEAIDTSILNIYRNVPWGYSFKFYLSASNDCHPNYVTYLTDKKTLSIKSVNKILNSILVDKKLLFDAEHIEQLYLLHQQTENFSDEKELNQLKKMLDGKKVLLLGPGNSIVSEHELISNYIETVKPVVIAVNYLPNYKVDYIFISNARRYVQLASRMCKLDPSIKTIATSNVTKASGEFDFTLDYCALLDTNALFQDNPMIMLIKFLGLCKASEIALAGFDGHTTIGTSDYVNPNMEYSFSKEKATEINNDAIASLKRLWQITPIQFITKTKYEEGLVR
jgi:4-hydroxy 2-oxovalerate aldolase